MSLSIFHQNRHCKLLFSVSIKHFLQGHYNWLLVQLSELVCGSTPRVKQANNRRLYPSFSAIRGSASVGWVFCILLVLFTRKAWRVTFQEALERESFKKQSQYHSSKTIWGKGDRYMSQFFFFWIFLFLFFILVTHSLGFWPNFTNQCSIKIEIFMVPMHWNRDQCTLW